MFNKNKKKLDSKIRYQNSRFTRKLENARSYKRVTRILPKNSREIFFAKLGLSTLLAKITTALVLFALIYIVYIPNFLFIKTITVQGGDQESNENVKSIANSFLEKKLPWPQKNLFLLSKNQLKSYLLSNDQRVLTVDKISKHFPAGLTINITPRTDKILLQTASSTDFTVSNDGLITSEIIVDASTSLPNLPILIKLGSGEGVFSGQHAFNNEKISYIQELSDKLPAIVKSPINYYQSNDLSDTEITAYIKTGFKILFDYNSDLQLNLNQLRLLFSQFSDSDLKKLYYVDMRFNGKSYVCQQGTACVKDINLPVQNNATTTPN